VGCIASWVQQGNVHGILLHNDVAVLLFAERLCHVQRQQDVQHWLLQSQTLHGKVLCCQASHRGMCNVLRTYLGGGGVPLHS
jgi:hypothetical protein